MTTEPTEAVDTGAKASTEDDRQPFSAFLAAHRDGRLGGELTAELADLIEAVERLEKGGTLNLKITVTHVGNGQVVVTDDITVKAPKPPRPQAIYFADNGSLSRRDPRQPVIPGL